LQTELQVFVTTMDSLAEWRCMGCIRNLRWASQSNYYSVPGEPNKYAS